MSLDPVSQQKFQDWMKAKCLLFLCPCCAQRSWDVGGLISGITNPPGGNVNIADAHLAPFVPVVCRNCGYTILFSATVMGLAPP
jgi:predicted nucleic-acid-binding Zn-ribbon protein